MATWSGIRKKLETEYLAQNLQGHIQYYATSYSRSPDHEGRAAIRYDGKEIINWPEQHYNNGVEKNTKTARRYKRTVRIFKKLANEMASEGIKSADIPSFLIECLIWNVKNSIFDYSTNYDRVKFSIIDVFNNTKEANVCSEWGEVSELKYLFRPIQPWTSEQANAFMSEAWNYIGFK